MIGSGLSFLAETQKREGILWEWGSSLGSEGFKPHIGHLGSGLQHQEKGLH